MPQVSVIVLTYNPDPVKLRQTLTAAANQLDVELEIIISDDGSTQKDFSFLPDFMKARGVMNFQLLEHNKNRGTVKSCLSAVEAASGEYVFLTSPGDFLFDAYVLRDFYRFAKDHNCTLCFGNAAFYRSENGSLTITRTYGSPSQPQLYAPEASLAQVKTCFFGGSWIIGASYFRQRQLALTCLESICDTAVYMEDTPTTAFALAAGERLCYFDRNVVWYEDGSGVSTSSNDKWKRLLKQDVALSFSKLKDMYPHDPYVDIAFCNATENNRVKRILRKFLRHPIIMSRLAFCRKAKKTAIHCTEEDMTQLNYLLKTT